MTHRLDSEELVRKLNFLGARDRLRSIAKQTRLIYSEAFSLNSGNQIYLKPENLQITGAFKIRGAYNKIAKLSPELRSKGLISASAGNHAQGVAYSAQLLQAKATIVMPKTTPLIKIEGTKKYGVEVILAGNCYDEAYEEALRIGRENDYTFIHPFNDVDVIEGQGTIAVEVLDELQDCDVIMVPVGGGGLISGIAVAAKSINPNIKIIGVEPEGAASMNCSISDGRILCLDSVVTIADGVAVKEPGDITFSIVNDYVDEIVTVSDYEIMETFIELLEYHKLIGESAGLLSVTGLKRISLRDKKIVSVLSGGNIDVLTVSSMVNKGLIAKGRIFGFTVNLPDKPGELLNVSKILADMNANVVEIEHDQFKLTDRFMDVSLKVTVEASGHEHIRRIIEELHKYGYNVKIMK